MSSDQYEPGRFEVFMTLALPFIGTAIGMALSYWLYHLDIPWRM